MRVRVYRNLHTGTLSMQTKTAKGWRVTSHPNSVKLENVKLVVKEAGRQRVLKEKRKNVHAWLEGDLIPKWTRAVMVFERVLYNPYKYAVWTTSSGVGVSLADGAKVNSWGEVWAYDVH